MPRATEIWTTGVPVLAGTLHRPVGPAIATVVMVPGSGPSDRDNDTYFPPIRDGLLAAGIAVASFDKRGVGGSAGDWHDTGPHEQSADVTAQVAAVRAAPDIDPATVGVFGHSQGGWVILEVAADDPSIAFVVTNSGPGVTWARQGRYATAAHLAADGASPDEVATALMAYDRIVGLVREGASFDIVERAASEAGQGENGPADAAELELARAWLDHDPRAALERMTSPVLALFGSADLIVPVDQSIAVFRAAFAGHADALTVHVFEGGDHRSRIGDPPVLHPGYLAVLTGWIRGVAGER